MKLLITGTSGFIGNKLLSAAIAKYGVENVLALSSNPSGQCETIIYDSNGFRVNECDYGKFEAIEVLVHAGAFTPKSNSQANDLKGCNGNIGFTGMLIGFPFPNLRKIIYLSTLDVYAPSALTTEETPTVPSTLYGLSKLYCERMIVQHSALADLESVVLRIGHVYGPGEDKYAKFLPRALANIVAGEPVELWGDGSDLRCFIYVDDVVRAILTSIETIENLGIVNVAGGTPISIKCLLDQIIKISGRSVEVISREFSGPGRDMVFDSSKCRQKLLPDETDLLTGLRSEYEYFRNLQ